MTLADPRPVEPSPTTREALSAIVASAVDTVPDAEYAGVSVRHIDGRITSHTPTTEMITRIDRLQATYQEGPCVSALRCEHTVLVDDLRAETHRWPRFARDAYAYGIASVMSLQLFSHENALGALNLYSTTRAAFGEESLQLARLFATQAALTFDDVPEIAHQHRRLETRDVIGQANGILMQRFGIDAETAFAMLVSSSHAIDMKLTTVAQWLTEHITDVPIER